MSKCWRLWEVESRNKSTMLRQIGHQKRSTKIIPMKNLAFFTNEAKQNIITSLEVCVNLLIQKNTLSLGYFQAKNFLQERSEIVKTVSEVSLTVEYGTWHATESSKYLLQASDTILE